MQISDIDVSLSQGQVLGKKQKKALKLFMIVPYMFHLYTILFIIILLINKIKWDELIIFIIVSFNFLFLLFLAMAIYIIEKDHKIKKKISLWLEDAIEVNALSRKIGENRLGFQPTAIKIQVRFKLNDKLYKKDSSAKVVEGWEGYLGVYKKYADREIRILYSQKYDEVLILKD